jgi:hypothetical protein
MENMTNLPAGGFSSPDIEGVLFGGPVRDCFGQEDYKGLGDRGASWRRVALGLTLPANRDIVDAYPWSYSLSRTIGLSRQPLSTRAILGIEPENVIHQAWTWIVERLPEGLFIRFLELLRYPEVIYTRSLDLWHQVTENIASLARTVREAGERFLDSTAAITRRIRVGGLFPEEREAFNVLAFNVLGGKSPPQWLADLKLIWDTIRNWFRKKEAVAIPAGFYTQARHKPFGLQVLTQWRDRPLLYTLAQADVDTIAVAYPRNLADPQLFAQASARHSQRLDLEMERRNAWLRWSQRVLNLVLTYIVLGPAGFIIMALRLLLANLLRVTPQGLLALV